MSNILNCNNVGGNLITERTAISTFFGNRCSIEKMYLNARRDEDGNIATDKPLHHLLINDIEMPVKDGGSFYELLWYQFLAENKDIYEKIMAYDEFDDGKDNVMNSTARVFRLLKKGGLNGLKSNCKDFLTRYNSKKASIPTPKEEIEETFVGLDTCAKKVIHKYKDTNFSKEEIIEMSVDNYIVSDKNVDILKRLVALRYDENADISSETFIKRVLNAIRRDFNKINNIEEDI